MITKILKNVVEIYHAHAKKACPICCGVICDGFYDTKRKIPTTFLCSLGIPSVSNLDNVFNLSLNKVQFSEIFLTMSHGEI